MGYNLKEKIKVTDEFLSELISKSWQETEAIQHQIDNIDTSTLLGAEVAKILKNTCTNYYVLIGCLETLADGVLNSLPLEGVPNEEPSLSTGPELIPELEIADKETDFQAEFDNAHTTVDSDFEPFEYFIDFEEPVGEPLTDDDLYS